MAPRNSSFTASPLNADLHHGTPSAKDNWRNLYQRNSDNVIDSHNLVLRPAAQDYTIMSRTCMTDSPPAPLPAAFEDIHPSMGATPYARTLLGLIKAVLDGALEVDAFCAAFGDYYVEHAPDKGVSLAQAELFAAVQQKIDWTDAAPTPRARRHGWVDHAQLLHWLRQRVAF